MTTKKNIGLLVGDELDWPDAFEALFRRVGKKVVHKGEAFELDVRRLRIDPFNLRDESRVDLVIDRLAYWHFTPREWLKKAALVNGVYLLNSPFTFQSMEKHSAYCAMIRLGLNIPETWLIPVKKGPSDEKFAEKFRRTAARYHDLFDLPAIAEKIGYPLFMKPFDGGGWRDVSKVTDRESLMRAYDKSGQTIMHLQKGVLDYEVFCRSLAIGPQSVSLNFDPEKPHHARYQIDDAFLSAEKRDEVRAIVKTINAFFRWDFNSCETIHKGGVVYPIDFANACPDVAVTSLHYYFPWAIKALVAWSIYCVVSRRKTHISVAPDAWFEIADSGRSYAEKLVAYEQLADAHFQTAEFEEFRATTLAHLDEATWELMGSAELDKILENTVRDLFPKHEHERFLAHFRGILRQWVESQR